MIDIDDIGVRMNIDLQQINGLRRRRKNESKISSIHALKQKLKYIMDQYIDEDAEFCVNISANLTHITST